ncbi:hypothetical protein MPLA_760002 [Mesorhizobium sp. ORS 3359]|nr:hypothetical protein MPLA_760002 [Mesorhizobium sp. ORS 3359]
MFAFTYGRTYSDDARDAIGQILLNSSTVVYGRRISYHHLPTICGIFADIRARTEPGSAPMQ